MPTVQDEIDERINIPLVLAAMVCAFVGLILTLTGALMFVGVPVMVLSIAWVIVLYYSAKFRAHSRMFQ